MIEAKIKLPVSYRPVFINYDVNGDKRGLFHGWTTKSELKADTLRGKYHFEQSLFGIIELSSGEVICIKSSDFKFIDSDYYFKIICFEYDAEAVKNMSPEEIKAILDDYNV